MVDLYVEELREQGRGFTGAEETFPCTFAVFAVGATFVALTITPPMKYVSWLRTRDQCGRSLSASGGQGELSNPAGRGSRYRSPGSRHRGRDGRPSP